MVSEKKTGVAGLVSRKEVAVLLRLDPRTLRQYEKAGLLRPIRVNCRVTRYRRDEVESFIAKLSAGSDNSLIGSS